MAKDIFIFCEQRDGVLENVSLELIGIASKLGKITKEKICCILFGYNLNGQAEKLIGYGADKVFICDNQEFKYYTTEAYSQGVYQIVTEQKPNILLFGATSIGRDLAPKLSAKLHTGLTADCTKLEADEQGDLFMTRPAFGGNLFATIVCPENKPQMSTVRPGVMKKNEFKAERKGEIIPVEIKFDKNKFRVKVIEEVLSKKTDDKIEDAKILVSCGRGVCGEENLNKIKSFAKNIGACVSSSRALVDACEMPQDRQVGQTGKTVRPNLYIALGISGAIQHLAGMEDSEFIVAVNKDKNAPIFSVAHLGIVGDAMKILPCLEKEILNYKAK